VETYGSCEERASATANGEGLGAATEADLFGDDDSLNGEILGSDRGSSSHHSTPRARWATDASGYTAMTLESLDRLLITVFPVSGDKTLTQDEFVLAIATSKWPRKVAERPIDAKVVIKSYSVSAPLVVDACGLGVPTAKLFWKVTLVKVKGEFWDELGLQREELLGDFGTADGSDVKYCP
jgi:hypothetical protein